jgi:hypothetical protein
MSRLATTISCPFSLCRISTVSPGATMSRHNPSAKYAGTEATPCKPGANTFGSRVAAVTMNAPSFDDVSPDVPRGFGLRSGDRILVDDGQGSRSLSLIGEPRCPCPFP